MLNKVKKIIINKFFKRKIRFYNTEKIFENKSLKNFYLDSHEIVLYFNAPVSSIYQVKQWIPILKELNKRAKLVIITRRYSSFKWLIKHTSFSVIFTHTYSDLMKTFEENNFKCILYVNHGVQNFQALAYRNALHVHINHGESEKTSTISNQLNAYNYVFIVAKAGYDQCRLNLLQKNMSVFKEIGRPQLEHIVEVPPFKTNRKIVLYAPTWEGTHTSMNYSSLDTFGEMIIQKILEDDKYYLLYKPHPNTGFNDDKIKKIDKKIKSILKNNPNAKVISNGDINALYSHIDIAIFDNSAVAIDYLSVDKPMIMTDMFYRAKDRQSKPIIVEGAIMLCEEKSKDIINIIDREIINDTLKNKRNKVKDYFLGKNNYKEKESTEKFISSVLDVISERDKLFSELKELNLKNKDLLE
ncbi:MAG: CDP-glycerol glycerophosphotransferase family protein [Sulfurovaceae bacterium]|nr:CDP-glycerol glycerophosphotransferase family protein [Sulfurovaceae bacterium]